MFRNILKAWVTLLSCMTALALALAPASARAQDAQTCHAYSDTVLPMEDARSRLAWDCSSGNWKSGNAVSWLHFLHPEQAEPPKVFASRITVFKQITIAAIGANGIIATQSYTPDQATPAVAGPIFSVPLPQTQEPVTSYLVRISSPHTATIASEAELMVDPEANHSLQGSLFLLAMVVGAMLMPLLFDVMFYVVLRERFVLMHAIMTLVIITYVMTSGGVITAFVELPVTAIAIIGPVAWAIGSGVAGLFISAFLEREAVPNWLRKTVLATAWTSMIVPGLCALQLEATQGFDNELFFLTSAPAIPVYMFAIFWALFSGSRSAIFLTLAWLPIMAASIDRLMRGMGLYASENSIDQTLFLALGLEVVLIGLAIALRFLAIRRERDRALTKARVMENLSERDQLTGLLNRRAIEDRFATLRAEGFTTLAVIDIDHFKQINDEYGHAIGDEVLKHVGTVLQSDEENCMAFRLGGEEFLLMLRGKSAFIHAEQARLDIQRNIAEAGLVKHEVTASMGLIDVPSAALTESGFEKLYALADRLLYEAKATGRNRTVSEKIKVFRQRRADRRTAA